jgi:hypothetical protein
MTYRISKGDLTVTADTEAELRIAIAMFNVAMFNERSTWVPEPLPALVNAPDWRVGGPRDVTPIGRAYLGEAMQPDIPYGMTTEVGERERPRLVALKCPDDPAVQHITVSRRNRAVLDAVTLFSEGVSTGSLAILLGLEQGVITGRVQALKKAGLVEKVQGHRLWVATTLARRGKLVTG